MIQGKPGMDKSVIACISKLEKEFAVRTKHLNPMIVPVSDNHTIFLVD